jgi:cell division protein ZapA (FtsZ GTPase activity inhibitor)
MDDASVRKPVRVTIFNQTYSLIASDDQGQVEELAHTVDQLMHEVAVRAGNVDTARTAVLTCLHLADQKRTLEREIEQLRQRVEAKARQFSVRLDEALTGSQNESR